MPNSTVPTNAVEQQQLQFGVISQDEQCQQYEGISTDGQQHAENEFGEVSDAKDPAAPAAVRALLDTLSREQLTRILINLTSRDSSVSEEIRAIAKAKRDVVVLGNKVFIRELEWQTTPETLRNVFAQYGTVTDVAVVTDKNTGRSKGFGFITFTETEAVTKALKDPQKTIDGRVTTSQSYAGSRNKPRAGEGRSTSGNVNRTLSTRDRRNLSPRRGRSRSPRRDRDRDRDRHRERDYDRRDRRDDRDSRGGEDRDRRASRWGAPVSHDDYDAPDYDSSRAAGYPPTTTTTTTTYPPPTYPPTTFSYSNAPPATSSYAPPHTSTYPKLTSYNSSYPQANGSSSYLSSSYPPSSSVPSSYPSYGSSSGYSSSASAPPPPADTQAYGQAPTFSGYGSATPSSGYSQY